MNDLDGAIRHLTQSRHAIVAERRALDKRLKQVERALEALGADPVTGRQALSNGHPVRNMPSHEEGARRRALVARFLQTWIDDLSEVFTAKDFMDWSGEPEHMLLAYQALMVRLAVEGTIIIDKKGAGKRPSAYRRAAE